MVESNTKNLTDAKGYCLEHPAIKLRRVTASGEWKTLLSSCPLCTDVTSRSPVASSSSSSASSSRRQRSIDQRQSPASSLSRSGRSPGNSVTSRTGELRRLTSLESVNSQQCGGDDQSEADSRNDRLSPLSPGKATLTVSQLFCKDMSTPSVSSSTDRTDATVASYSSGSAASSSGASSVEPQLSYTLRRPSLPSPSLPPASPYSPSASGGRRSSTGGASKKAVVCGLRYANPTNNRRGSYTGQLHPESQVPHGIGTLRYYDGSVDEGEWRDGVLVDSATDAPSVSATTRSRSRGRRRGTIEEAEAKDNNNTTRNSARSKSRGRRSSTLEHDDFAETKSTVGSRRGRSSYTTESDDTYRTTRGKSRGRNTPSSSESCTPNEMRRSKSTVRDNRARSKSRTSRHQEIRPELTVPDFDMGDGSSWCQPCGSGGGDDGSTMSCSAPPPPPENSLIGNASSQHLREGPSSRQQQQQQQPFMCAPCSPEGAGYHSRSGSYQDNTPGNYSNYSSNASSRDHRRHNSHRQEFRNNIGNGSSSNSNNNRVEVSLPSHFEPGAALVPYPNQGNKEGDGDDDDNSLGTCEKSQYSKYSRSSSTRTGNMSRSSSGRKLSAGPYSARESKVSLANQSSSSPGVTVNNTSTSRLSQHVVENNNNDLFEDSDRSGQRLSRRHFVEVKR